MKRISKKILILTIQLCASTSLGDITTVDELLFEIKKNAIQIDIAKNQKKSDSILANKRKLIFRTKGFAKVLHANQNNPQTSPFSTSRNTNSEYSLGVDKLWESGIKSELSYSLSDVSNVFYSGQSNSFLTPRLQLNLSSSVFQDLVHHRYDYLNDEIDKSLKTLDVGLKIEQKKVLTESLLAISSLLERKENLSLQKNICEKTKVQSNKLSQKRDRQSISNREYYLSLRESTLCEALVADLTKQLYEAQKEVESSYNISANLFEDIDNKLIFKDFEKKYQSLQVKNDVSTYVNQKDEIVYLDSLLDAAKSKQSNLEASSKTNLAFEVSVGATGLDPALSNAHQDLGDLRYPFFTMGLRLDLPLSDKDALAEASSNFYKMRVIEEQKKLATSHKTERFETLIQILKQEFSIYKKYVRSIGISKKVLSEARKDFNNGRIDFFTLTEFNKSLIQDQKTLSSYRIQLLIRMVEYLDFHSYFDLYLKDQG